ncbi:MAG: Hsp20/alpha crystallin family protein [Candidatus Thermoplasmatota archaeon]
MEKKEPVLVRNLRKNIRPKLLTKREFLTPYHENIFSLIDRVESLKDELEHFFWYHPIGAYKITSGIREPLVDVIDREKEIVVRAEIPGFDKDSIDIKVGKDSVEIKCERKEEVKEKDVGYIRKEREFSTLYRSIPLPVATLPEKAKAELSNGILEIFIPKSEKEKKVKVGIK